MIPERVAYRFVAQFIAVDGVRARFRRAGSPRHERIVIAQEAWQEMGEPKVVTVVVKPGDLLDEGTL